MIPRGWQAPRAWGIGAGWLLLVAAPIASTVLLLGGVGEDAAPVGSVSPVEDGLPVHRLLLAVIVIVGFCRLAGLAARALRQPSVVGEIAAGMVLGPSVLGAVWPRGHAALFPPDVVAPLGTLALLGVVLFVFLAAMEIDVGLLRGSGRVTSVVSAAGLAVPILLGVGFAVVAYPTLAPGGIGLVPFALFVGTALSVTALPVLADILRNSPLAGGRLAVIALTCATVDDVVAWMLLALVAGLVAGTTGGVVAVLGLTVAFVAVLVLVVRPALALLFATRLTSPGARLVALMVGVLSSAAVTDWIGIHAVTGAFLFGLVAPREPGLAAEVTARLGAFTATLLLPVFFATSGLNTELSGVGVALWWWLALALVVAVAGKFGGTAIAARAVGTPWRDSLRLGVLMNCRGLTELVVLGVGLELGVLSPTAFTVLAITALACTAMTWPALGCARPPTPSRPQRECDDHESRRQHPADRGRPRPDARDTAAR